MSQHPLLPQVSQFTSGKDTLFVCPSMSVRTRVLRNLSAGTSQVSLLYDAIPLFASNSALIAGPLIGAPAALMSVEPFLAVRSLKKIVFIGSTGGLAFGSSHIRVGDIISPTFFRSREYSLGPTKYKDTQASASQLELRTILSSLGHSQSEGGVISIDSPFQESATECQGLFEDDILGIDMEAAAVAALCEKYKTEYAAVLIVSDIISPSGSSGFKKQAFLDSLDAILPSLFEFPFFGLK